VPHPPKATFPNGWRKALAIRREAFDNGSNVSRSERAGKPVFEENKPASAALNSLTSAAFSRRDPSFATSIFAVIGLESSVQRIVFIFAGFIPFIFYFFLCESA
jgi:hypothetical protein